MEVLVLEEKEDKRSVWNKGIEDKLFGEMVRKPVLLEGKNNAHRAHRNSLHRSLVHCDGPAELKRLIKRNHHHLNASDVLA